MAILLNMLILSIDGLHWKGSARSLFVKNCVKFALILPERHNLYTTIGCIFCRHLLILRSQFIPPLHYLYSVYYAHVHYLYNAYFLYNICIINTTCTVYTTFIAYTTCTIYMYIVHHPPLCQVEKSEHLTLTTLDSLIAWCQVREGGQSG